MAFQRNKGYAVFYPMRRNVLSTLPDGRPVVGHQPGQHRIGLIIDEHSAWFDLIQEDLELLQVDLEGGEYINMVPGNPCKHCDMREQKVEFRAFLERACGILIPLTDNHRGMSDIDRLREPLQPGADQVIEILS